MFETNLAHLEESALSRLGDYEAVVFEGKSFSAGELHDEACRLAGGLADLGVGAGDRVVVLITNRPEVRVAYVACWRLGAIVVPITTTSSVRDLTRALIEAQPAAVLAEVAALPQLRACLEKAGSSAPIVAIDDEGLEPGYHAWDDVLTASTTPLASVKAEDVAALLFTGGTTGQSKGVALTHGGIAAAGESRMSMWYEGSKATVVMPLPLSHVFGLLLLATDMHWPAQRRQVLMRRFEALVALQLVETHRATELCLVPAAVESLLDHDLTRFDLSSLQYVVCGSAPLRTSTHLSFIHALPGVELRMGYGLSEASGLVTGTRRGETVIGSVGRAAPGVAVRIVDEDDTDVPTGTPGEVVCRSPFIMNGYWNDPTATDAVIRDGWLHTGDLGRVDERGNVFIVGRKKDLIIRSGFNVYPAEVEAALMEHPRIDCAVVVGRPDDRRGEEVVAFVTLNGDTPLTAEDLRRFARETIGGYKYPREIHLLEAIPRTPLGKIDRVALRAHLTSDAAPTPEEPRPPYGRDSTIA